MIRAEAEKLGDALSEKGRENESLKTRIIELETRALQNIELENQIMRLGDELKSASLKNRELISDLEIGN
jgi:uncharacterized protein YigA (DUF484 family)